MGLPEKQGLYDPRNEHDACGVGFVADIKGRKTHDIVSQGLRILVNLDHRGAVGADPLMGDGAGAMIQIPDALLRDWARKEGVDLPEPGHYAVAMCFLPQDEKARAFAVKRFEHFVKVEKQKLLGWRDVPTDLTGLGKAVIASMPVIKQAVIAKGSAAMTQAAFERKLLAIRKETQNPLAEVAKKKNLPGLAEFYMPSLSTRTIVYKGLLLAGQVGTFYRDLTNPLCESALALVHQRFSTNTFPSWKLAHPYRFIAHNGEINTVRGNVNWMYARRRSMESPLLGADLDKMWPLIPHGQSDTACLDNALELLVAGGYSLAHAMMMLIPEAWAGNPLMGAQRRAFYEYHAALMEPWDGPAAMAFTDGRQIGATLDRNGLRPARFIVTDDDYIVMASEVGVLDIPESKVVKKWRLQPGKMLLVDLEQGRIVDDEELKRTLAREKPYREWIDACRMRLEDMPEPAPAEPPSVPLLDRQQAFGYSQEDVKILLTPMAQNGEEALGSMGNDAALPVLSDRPKVFYNYFKQLFAQVTNPPIDPIREAIVMSLNSFIGPKPNLLDINAVNPPMRLEVTQPVLDFDDMARLRQIERHTSAKFKTHVLDITYPLAWGDEGVEAKLASLCAEAVDAIATGHNILIISDRAMNRDNVAIPALLALSAIHQHLVREGLRTTAGLVVETGSAREVHHFAVLAGYGAEAVHPYLAMETLASLHKELPGELSAEKAIYNYVKAIGKGLSKIMSKMGVSTYMSYCGAQLFEAIGLDKPLVEKYFRGTASQVGGITARICWRIARAAMTSCASLDRCSTAEIHRYALARCSAGSRPVAASGSAEKKCLPAWK